MSIKDNDEIKFALSESRHDDAHGCHLSDGIPGRVATNTVHE